MRLGIEDWQQWLEDVPDRVLENWRAHYAVEPWGDERLILSKVVHFLSVIVACKLSESEIQQAVQDNMPYEWFYRNPEPQEPSLEDQLEGLKEAFKGMGY